MLTAENTLIQIMNSLRGLGLQLDTRISIGAACAVLILPGIFYVLAVVIYRLYFHPLARFPGPLLGRLTGARAGYFAAIGDIHIDMWRCHEKYGPVVRYMPHFLIFNSPRAVKDMYSYSNNLSKPSEYQMLVHGAPSTFSLIDRKEHAWKRRLLSQAFSDNAIRSYEPLLLSQVDKFLARLCSGDSTNIPGSTPKLGVWSKPFNMALWCDYLFFDLITNIVFGRTYNLLGSDENRYITQAIQDSNVRMGTIAQWPAIIWRRLDKKLFPKSIKARGKFLRFMIKIAKDRMATVNNSDIFSVLLKSKDPETGKALSEQELGAESITMIVAGSDTSASLMASMFFYLTRNPRVHQRLVQEIRHIFLSEAEIRLGPKLNSCTYLRACMNECLRMSPPVGSAPSRAVPKEGVVVDGHFVPGNMTTGVGLYSLHHNEETFSESFSFKPERWLDTANVTKSTDSIAFAPFASGPRSCLGRSLAQSEISLAIAKVCYTLEFRAADGLESVGAGVKGSTYGRHRDWEYQLHDHVLNGLKDGPWLQFRVRE